MLLTLLRHDSPSVVNQCVFSMLLQILYRARTGSRAIQIGLPKLYVVFAHLEKRLRFTVSLSSVVACWFRLSTAICAVLSAGVGILATVVNLFDHPTFF